MAQRKEKKSYLKLKVQIPMTDEVFPVRFIEPTSKIKFLRSNLELATGISEELQVVNYLDEGNLSDTSDVKHNAIVNGATLTMHVWPTWKDLVEASAINDPDWLFRLGVTKNTTFKTPNSEYMTPKKRQQWIQKRADVALMIASHRGHADLCQRLIDWGANVNSTTPLGRTPLHFSATQDHGAVINLLLTNGANINLADNDGHNALSLANMFGHKGCERHLFMFRWQERAKASKPQYLDPPPMAFQVCDSLYPKWKSGPTAQLYIQKLLPPGEFLGTAFHAPKRNWHRKSSAPPHLRPLQSENHPISAENTKRQTFDEWMKKKEADYLVQVKLRKAKEAEERANELEKIRKEEERIREAEAYADSIAGDTTVGHRTSGDPGPRTAGLGASKRRVLSPIDGDASGAAGYSFGGEVIVFDPSSHQAHSSNPNRGSDDLQARIDRLLAKHGVSDSDTNLTAYEHWLRQRGLKPSLLHYHQMINEFCDRKQNYIAIQ